jgi:hypothetical protein
MPSAACCRLARCDCAWKCFGQWIVLGSALDVTLCACCGDSCTLGHSHTTSKNLTFVDIDRRPLMPPTLAEVIDCSKTIRLRGGGQGVLLRRLGEKAPEGVYCCQFSQQGQPLAPRPLQTPFLIYPTISAGCLWRAPAWRVPTRGSPYSFNI